MTNTFDTRKTWGNKRVLVEGLEIGKRMKKTFEFFQFFNFTMLFLQANQEKSLALKRKLQVTDSTTALEDIKG